MKTSNKVRLTDEARRQDVSVLTLIRRAMEQTGGDVSKAARLLKCSRTAIYYHISIAGARINRTVEREIA